MHTHNKQAGRQAVTDLHTCTQPCVCVSWSKMQAMPITAGQPTHIDIVVQTEGLSGGHMTWGSEPGGQHSNPQQGVADAAGKGGSGAQEASQRVPEQAQRPPHHTKWQPC